MVEDERVEDALRDVVGGAVDVSREAYGDFLARAHEEATRRVLERLTLVIRHAPIFGALIELEQSWLETEALGERAPARKRKEVLIQAQLVLEHLLVAWKLRWPIRGAAAPLAEKDRAFNKKILEGIAARLGFSTPLPPSLAHVRKGKIESAGENQHGASLRPDLLAALLIANHEPDHPLWRLARALPDGLMMLNRLGELCDAGAHASSRTFVLEELRAQLETVYAVCEATRE